MSNTPGIEIRDLRGQEWVWTHKAILFDERVDGNAYKTYGGLASYANNNTQEAFPSINTLAKRLHLSRTTVIGGIGKLEKAGYVRVDRTEGEHNVYTLLSVGAPALEIVSAEPTSQQPEKPKDRARAFFDGVLALMAGEDVPWLKDFLRGFSERYDVPKSAVWDEVKAFCAYWTEKNGMGTKEAWELQKTFEVERRLMTWFRRNKMRARQGQAAPRGGKEII